MLQEAYKTATTASGSALREQERYSEGVQAHINELKASLEELSFVLINSGFAKDALDFLTSIVRLLSSFNTVGLITIGILVRMGAQIATAKLLTFVSGKQAEMMDRLTLATKRQTQAQKENNAAKLEAIGVTTGATAVGNAEIAEKTATGVGTSTGGLASVLGGASAAFVGITAAISLAVAGYMWYNSVREQELENSKSIARQYDTESAKLADVTAKYKELSKELLLARGNDEKTYEVKQQLLDIQNQINDSVDSQKEKVDLVTGAYQEQLGVLKEIAKTSAQETLNQIDDEYGINDVLEKFEYQSFRYIDTWATTGNNELDARINGLARQFNVTIEEWDGALKRLKTSGTTEEAYQNLLDFQLALSDLNKEAQNDSVSDLIEKIGQRAQSYKSDINEFGDLYRSILNAQLEKDETLNGYKAQAEDLVQTYTDALLQAEDNIADQNVQKAYQRLAEFKEFLQAQYPQFQTIWAGIFAPADTQGKQKFAQRVNDIKQQLPSLSSMNEWQFRSAWTDDKNLDVHRLKNIVDYDKEISLGLEDIVDVLLRLKVLVPTVADVAEQKLAKTSGQMVDAVQGFAGGLKQIREVLADVQNGGEFSWDSIASDKFNLEEGVFQGLSKEVEEYRNVMADATTDMDSAQQAANNLATVLLHQSHVLDDVTQATKESTIADLEAQGISNARALVEQALTVAELDSIAAEYNLARAHINATESLDEQAGALEKESQELRDEVDALEGATEATRLYWLERQIVSQTANGFSAWSDVQQLAQVVEALGIASSAWTSYYEARANMAKYQARIDAGGILSLTSDERIAYHRAEAQAQGASKRAQADMKALVEAKVSPSGGTSSGGGGGGDSDKEFDWIERKIANIEKRISEVKEKAESAYDEVTEYANDAIKDAQENLLNEYDKISDWGLDAYADAIKNQTLQSKFGNIDMDKRAIMQWSNELKNAFKDELASWEYDPEIGSIDTVFGTSGEYGGIEIAFSPILQTDNGAVFLSQQNVDTYISTLMSQLSGDWTTEDLLALDAEGMEVDGQRIKNIIADIGETAETTGELMHFAGEFGAIALAENEVTKAQQRQNQIRKTKLDYMEQECALLNDEIDVLQQAYTQYMNKANTFDIPQEYKDLVANGGLIAETISDKGLQEAIENYQSYYDKAVETENKIKELKKQSLDIIVQQYDFEKSHLDELHDNEVISTREYLDEMLQLYYKYYANRAEMETLAHQKRLEYLNAEKDYLNDVASAAASLIGTRISELEAKRDKEIDKINKKKDALQDELDALNDEAEREDKLLALEQARYDLEKKKNQRTSLVYKDNQMVYQTDDKGIRDAQNKVKDAEKDWKVFQIQQQIDDLDDAIDRINEKYDDQIRKLQDAQNEWQKLIDQQTQAQQQLLITSMFGEDAIDKIMHGNDADLRDSWMEKYIQRLAQIDNESAGHVSKMTEELAKLYNVDVNDVQTEFDAIVQAVDGVTEATNNASGAMNGSGGASATPSGLGNTGTPEAQTQAPVSGGGSSDSLKGAIDDTVDNGVERFNELTDEMYNVLIPATQAAWEWMEKYNESADKDIEKTVTIHVKTVGGAGADGTAHVAGTAFKRGSWGVKPKDTGESLVGKQLLTLNLFNCWDTLRALLTTA